VEKHEACSLRVVAEVRSLANGSRGTLVQRSVICA
jgi:hypothetical protein